MPVGRRAHHVFGADGAASAAAALDDERLTEHLGEPVGGDPPEHICDAARAVLMLRSFSSPKLRPNRICKFRTGNPHIARPHGTVAANVPGDMHAANVGFLSSP